MREQRGITGLETAIILIAFVIVASVFAFTILSVGVFSAQKSQETAYAGLEETRGTLNPNGALIVKSGSVAGTTGAVQAIFTVTLAVDGNPVDLTPPYTVNDTGTDPDPSGLRAPTVISYTTASKHVSDAQWTVTFPGDDDGDYLLEKNETAEITVWLHQKQADGTYALGTATNAFLETRLLANGKVAIEIKPSNGATFKLERTLPPSLQSVMSLN
jgi:flagellin FlaB